MLPFYVKDDLSAQKRHEPVKFMTHGGGNQRESTILSLYLLGLPNEGLVKLEEARTTWDAEQKGREHLKGKIEQETGKTLEVLRTDLVSAETRLSEITKAVRDFNLFEGFEEVSAALSKLEADASEQRKLATQSRRQLEKLRRFLDVTDEIDAAGVIQQYNDVSAALGAAVRKSIEEVMEFRRSLAQQRLRFHGKRLVELDRTHNEAVQRLSELEQQRSSLMRAVDTTNFHETFDSAIQRLATEHGDLERYRATIGQIKLADDRISSLELLMQTYRHEAAAALRTVEEQIDRVRARYIDVVHNAVTTSADEVAGAALDIVSQSGTAAKALPVKISVSLPKVDALGFARLLLVAYDLTVLLTQVEEDLALPRFLIQDGVFHGIAKRIAVKTLNYVYRQALAAQADYRPFQYIATFNVDELSSAEQDQARDGAYEFDVGDVTVASLSDDPGGRFFKREF
ncbi:DUF2326 domain-containing protein [Roseateles chitinivorans]|uniref:DUF2326 domain-containing protein n=1 Tax=Roseateles chitinivorans TaxID=2917965 RepID=UPI003D670D73